MNTKQGLTPIVLVIIAAILLSGGYVVAYKWFNYSFSTDNPPNQIRAEDLQWEKLTGDISDWKTYRSEKYGFEFKHPSYLTPFNAIKNDKLIPADSSDGRITIAENEQKAICCEPIALAFEVNVEKANRVYQENVGAKTKFGAYDAVIVYGEGNLGSIYKTIAIPRNGENSVLITLNATSELLEKILSTFKFTK